MPSKVLLVRERKQCNAETRVGGLRVSLCATFYRLSSSLLLSGTQVPESPGNLSSIAIFLQSTRHAFDRIKHSRKVWGNMCR
jgi:hypothetical protein